MAGIHQEFRFQHASSIKHASCHSRADIDEFALNSGFVQEYLTNVEFVQK